jgi:hypothetical protein
MTRNLALAAAISLAMPLVAADDPKDPMASCPMHAQHMAAKSAANGSAAHGAEVDTRHDTFGMPHDASTHSFRLFADGGAIELRTNTAGDKAAVTAIRTHLEKVVGQFVAADFSTPAFVHGARPDGVTEMERLRAALAYRYEPLPAGGRIRITVKSAEALAAVHAFLRFQVTEHHTANSGEVEADGNLY